MVTLRDKFLGCIGASWVGSAMGAAVADPYTNSRRSMAATADGLFEAYMARRRRVQQYLDSMGDEAFLAK